MLTRRFFVKAGLATGGLAGLTGAYTWLWEPHWLEVVERPLALPLLSTELRGARLAHLSDLHIGPRVSDSYLRRVFERVREIGPEIVVYTGDFMSYHSDVFRHCRQMFEYLPLGSLATFGVLGNHDYGRGWKEPDVAQSITELAEAAGVRILRNELAELDGLQIVGLDDWWGGQFDLKRAFVDLDATRSAIALSHNPDTVDLDGWQGFSGWVLAGHTHGGQCKPPFLPPPLLPVENRLYTAGEFELDQRRRMYVSRGVGHLLKVRFNVRPEVTLFHLVEA